MAAPHRSSPPPLLGPAGGVAVPTCEYEGSKGRSLLSFPVQFQGARGGGGRDGAASRGPSALRSQTKVGRRRRGPRGEGGASRSKSETERVAASLCQPWRRIPAALAQGRALLGEEGHDGGHAGPFPQPLACVSETDSGTLSKTRSSPLDPPFRRRATA